MNILITGSNGFVMSVLARQLLESDPAVHITGCSTSLPDDLLLEFIGDYLSRVDFRQLDVRDRQAVTAAIASAEPEVVIHGAAVTHSAELERTDPVRFIDVNVMGATHVLDAACRQRSVRKVILVSSGAVYGAGEPQAAPLGEDAPLVPNELYGISKVASELVAERFRDLYGMNIDILRLGKIFGPMERPTSGRSVMSVPFRLAAAVVAGEEAIVTARTMHSSGDWTSAVDIAVAIAGLCRDTTPRCGTYNLAAGVLTPLADLAEAFGARIVVVDAASGSQRQVIDSDPALRWGKEGSFSIHKATRELSWQPRPLPEQVAEYAEWARAHPICFAGGHGAI